MKRLLAGATTGIAVAAGLSAGSFVYRSRYVAPYRPVLEHLIVPPPPAHPALAGLRIAFISDCHVGPFFSGRDLEAAARLAIAWKPDLVLLGGDFMSEAPRFAADAAHALEPLVRAAPLGACAVLGNHDLVFGGPHITAALEAVGVVVLRNESAAVRYRGDTLWIAGLDDSMVGSPDVAATVAGIPSGSAIVGLWHEPDGADQLANAGAFLQLSGHSHGGQVRLPLVGHIASPPGGRRFVIGFNRVNGMIVYTSRGVGTYRPAIRVNCPPEVTLITLVDPASTVTT